MALSYCRETVTETSLPVRVENLQSIWTILYTLPSRYNWMFQFYLRDAGLEMSWVGSGRMIMSFNFTDHDFQQVLTRFVQAAQAMQADGWWWQSATLSNKSIKRQMLREMLVARFPMLNKLIKQPLTPCPEQPLEEII